MLAPKNITIGFVAVLTLLLLSGVVAAATDTLSVTACETTSCTVSNLNTNNTVGTTIADGNTIETVMSTLSSQATTINSVILRIRWTEGADTNGAPGNRVNLESNSGNSAYCTEQTDTQAASGDEYHEYNFTSCGLTESQINDIQVYYMNDDAGKSGSVTLTFVQLYVEYNNPPSFTNGLDANATTVTTGDVIQFNATGSDLESDPYRLVVCTANSISDGFPGTCSGGGSLVCNSTSTSSGSTATCTNTTVEAMEGTNTYYGFLCDSTGDCNATSTTKSITVNPEFGWLNVSIDLPTDSTAVSIGETFIINATITCEGGAAAKCGRVEAIARYNQSGSTPDTNMSITEGVTPLYNIEKPPKTVPEQIATISNNSITGAQRVQVVGNYAYVVSWGNNAFTVFNITDPYNPVQVTTISNASSIGNPREVRVDGDYAYVAASNTNSLTIFNISIPYNPIQVGTVSNGGSLAGAYGLDIQGNYAYVSTNTNHSLTIINITNKNSPTITGTVSNSTINTSYGVAVQGDYAYVVGSISDTFTVFNISNKNNPVQIATITNSSSINSARGVDVIGNYAYVVSLLSNSLTIFNITDPGNPYQIAQLVNSSTLSLSVYVYVEEDYAFVTGSDSLTIINVTDKKNPKQIATISNSSALNDAYGVDVQGDNAYVTSLINRSLTIIDFRDTNPQYAILSQGESWNVNWTVNYTGTAGSAYEVDVLFNSTSYYPNVAANDTADRTVLNATGGGGGSSCTYSSGDWVVDFGDNCVVSSNVDVYPNALILTGASGTFTIQSGATVSVKERRIEPTDFDGDIQFIVESGGRLEVKP